MNKARPRVLYVTNTTSRFVAIDETLLRERYHVQSLHVRRKSPALLWQSWQALNGCDVVIAWFASWHSLPVFLWAALRGVPRILITGGYDVANEPAIAYGLRRGGLPKLISGLVFRLSTCALPFSQAAYDEALRHTPLPPGKMETLLLGMQDDSAFQQPTDKEAIALTVSGLNPVAVRRKGIAEFVQAAQYLPDVRFVVVGKGDPETVRELQRLAAPNVEFTGYLPADDLTALRQRAAVYVQASHHEGFGLALAESMLARCAPVISRRGSLPEVVGDTGVYVDAVQPQAIAQGVREALARQLTLGEAARQRIVAQFPLSLRAQRFYAVIDSVLESR